MRNWSALFASLLVGLTLAVAGIDDAAAKRLGGGKSFGSKSLFSSSSKRQGSSPGAAAKQSPAQQRNVQQRSAMANRGGLMGMLGGLALGGLLGALFFGGAFENLNFMDILIFGGIAFLLYKLFTARKRTPAGRVGATGSSMPGSGGAGAGYAGSGPAKRDFDTDVMFGKGGSGSASGAAAGPTQAAPAEPRGFDRKAFLSGAETAYRQLQASWDQGDLADIRALTTDAVFAELQDQLRERSGENRTELLKVGTELLEVREVGSQVEAAVMFDVLMREVDADTSTDSRTRQVREVWHFVRPKDSAQPTWFLDGIQQLED